MVGLIHLSIEKIKKKKKGKNLSKQVFVEFKVTEP